MDLFKRASFRHGEGTIDTWNDVPAVRSDRPISTSHLAAPPVQKKEALESFQLEPDDPNKMRQTRNHYRCYPDVPYYGLLEGIDVQIDINSAATSSLTDSSSLNLSGVATYISELNGALCDVVNRYGSFFYIGNSMLPLDDVPPANATIPSTAAKSSSAAAGAVAGSSSGSSVVYEVYLHALIELFQTMSQIRNRCCASNLAPTSGLDGGPGEAPLACEPRGGVLHTHHVVYARLSGHPTLKDLSLMLAIERGRMVLFVSSSSRVTQAYLSEQAEVVQLKLRWVSGAALVWEPDRLHSSEVNPVLALWDVLMNAPLTGPVDATDPTLAGSEKAVQEVLFHQMAVASRVLEGFGWIVLSSLSFSGARQGKATLRLQDPSVLRGTRDRDAPGDEIIGHRYVWRLVGPFRNVVLPHLLTHMLQCLVNFECAGHYLRSFIVRTRGADRGEKPEHRNPKRRAGPESDGVAGLSYIRSERTGLTTQRGPSSQSWVGFSRLSGNAWLSDEERQQLGLLVVDDDGEVALECEFTLGEIRYCRMTPMDKFSKESVMKWQLRKRPRSPLQLNGDMEDHMCWSSPSCFDCGVPDLFSVGNPEEWGPYFDWNVCVTRLLDYTDNESDEDG
ncbi:unnamed protein product [Phytomonas sp. EM1]|nr:unnamed protein product [Phytomonas sp. EM1]|eukprot:CCW60622.1 unnamed protein product [Phytomonas sp. isolate EM1]